MTVLQGEQLQAFAGAGVLTVVPSSPALTEERITPAALPSSEPGTGQWERTVVAGDLAVPPPGFRYVNQICTVCLSGQNLSGATQTIYYRDYLNATKQDDASFSVSNGNYWTLQVYLPNLKAGDALSLRVWCASADVNLDTRIWQFCGSRLTPAMGAWGLYVGLTIAAPAAQGNCSLSGATNAGLAAVYEIDNGRDVTRASTVSASSYTLFAAGPSYGLYALYEPERAAQTTNSGVSHPRYLRVFAPASLTYRNVNARIPA